MTKFTSVIIFILLFLNNLQGQQISPFIHIDQFGYTTNADKVAVLSDPQTGYNGSGIYNPSSTLELRDATNDNVVFSGSPSIWNSGATHTQSGDKGWWFDFSSYSIPGEYYVYDAGNNARSGNFTIADNMYGDLMITAGRMYFYNRCNYEKASPYAESDWTDGINFTNNLQDANCRYINDQNNAALEKDLTGGWFDAGDFNKYVTFAYPAIHNLLSAYEENPAAFGDNWNIPESDNGIPDILDEAKWELDWLMKMNNSDGSTHIKMGSKNYSENTQIPPSLNTDPRYYGPTCSAASIAVAGMFAHAAKVYDGISGMSTYAQELEDRAIQSWNYVLPMLNNNTLETLCDDGSIISGDADWQVSDQESHAVTAAIHLFDLTGDSSYEQYVTNNYQSVEQLVNGFWSGYRMPSNDALLLYTTLNGINNNTKNNIINSITTASGNNWNGFYGNNSDDLYRAFMPDGQYHWGSSVPKAGFGILNMLLVKYGIQPSNATAYTARALDHVHYFHGINPQGMVQMSNMYELGGDRCVNQIYHQWFWDGTQWDDALTSTYGPAPGFVTGGANKDFSVTTISPPSNQPPQKCYLDFNTGWPDNSWEISEPSITYQSFYIRLLAWFSRPDDPVSNTNILVSQDCIEIYPNPINDIFTVSGSLSNYNIDVLDVTGAVVQTLSNQGNNTSVDISTLGSGTYFVRVSNSSNSNLCVEKIIKQ